MTERQGTRDREAVWELLSRGGTVCTSTQRLSRELRRGYDAHMEHEGRGAWAAPKVIPFGSWLSSLVREHLLFGDTQLLEGTQLLSAAQEALTWEQAIAAAGVGDEILQTDALSVMMMEAHQIEHAWSMRDADLLRYRNEGSAAYLAVRSHAQRLWRERGLLPGSMLPRLAMDVLRSAPDLLPAHFLLAGFDLLPDASMRDFRALYTRHRGPLLTYDPAGFPAQGEMFRYESFEDELHAAAQWSRELLLRGENGIGIIVPALDTVHAAVKTVFTDVLFPGVRPGELTDPMPFELSLGTRCAEEPVLSAALWAVELLRAQVATDAVSALLRSPYVFGAQRHRAHRARLDLRLRRSGVERLRHREIVRLLDGGEDEDPLTGAIADRAAVQSAKSAADWVREIDALLRAFGWPGDAALTSREYQAVRRWKDLLEEFESFDAVLSPMSVSEMLTRLRRMLAERIFQPEARHAPVQVMGMLETAGLRFQHARVVGMNEERWPPPARIHPFHPLRLQRAMRVTEAVPERYLAQMRTVTGRISGLAPDTVFTCSRHDGDRELLPSPLLRERPITEATVSRHTYARLMQEAWPGGLELRPEDIVPPVSREENIYGGVRVLTLQSDCPFRAFAELRLHAEEPEIAEAGLRPLDRGNLLHAALELLWGRLGSQAALLQTEDDALRLMLDDAIAYAEETQTTLRSAQYPSHVMEAERACLRVILEEWLIMERERPPFTVAGREEEREGAFGELSLRMRVDRIDRLADGSLLLIDYKTGSHGPSEWMDARPAQPQLPMYTMTGEDDFGAAAFGILQRGNCRLHGIARKRELVPQLQEAEAFLSAHGQEDGTWATLMDSWRTTLTALAETFAAGSARVDPRNGEETCRFCSLHAFCRIHEYRQEGGSGD